MTKQIEMGLHLDPGHTTQGQLNLIKELTTQIGMKQLFSLLDLSQGPEMPSKHTQVSFDMRGKIQTFFASTQDCCIEKAKVVFDCLINSKRWKQLQVCQNEFKLPILTSGSDHSHQIFGS